MDGSSRYRSARVLGLDAAGKENRPHAGYAVKAVSWLVRSGELLPCSLPGGNLRGRNRRHRLAVRLDQRRERAFKGNLQYFVHLVDEVQLHRVFERLG